MRPTQPTNTRKRPPVDPLNTPTPKKRPIQTQLSHWRRGQTTRQNDDSNHSTHSEPRGLDQQLAKQASADAVSLVYNEVAAHGGGSSSGGDIGGNTQRNKANLSCATASACASSDADADCDCDGPLVCTTNPEAAAKGSNGAVDARSFSAANDCEAGGGDINSGGCGGRAPQIQNGSSCATAVADAIYPRERARNPPCPGSRGDTPLGQGFGGGPQV